MKVTFLGTGTSQGVPMMACECEVCKSPDPMDKRLRSSVMIEENGQVFIVDVGPDFRQQMLREGVTKIDAILMTHEHQDHLAGLDEVRSYNFKMKKPIELYAEKRVHERIKMQFGYIFAKNKYPGVPDINMHKVALELFSINNVQMLPIRVFHHKLPVLGYRLGTFAYITDANNIPQEELSKLIGLKVLVVNALRIQKHLSHYNLDEALELISKLGPEKAYLTHISHEMGFYKDVSKILPENVFLSYDGLRLSL